MGHELKKELDKIEIPRELHDRIRMGVTRAKSEQPNKKSKRTLVAAAVVALGMGISLSPMGQAMYDGLLQVTKFEEKGNMKETSFGQGFRNLNIYEEKNYQSLDEIKSSFNISVPFPGALLSMKGKESTGYNVGVAEGGKFSFYDYRLTTAERSYDVRATNENDAEVEFSAETTDGTAFEKDMNINGVPAKIMKVPDMDGYMIFLEKAGWKVIISCFDKANNINGIADVKEEEVVRIAESIEW